MRLIRSVLAMSEGCFGGPVDRPATLMVATELIRRFSKNLSIFKQKNDEKWMHLKNSTNHMAFELVKQTI